MPDSRDYIYRLLVNKNTVVQVETQELENRLKVWCNKVGLKLSRGDRKSYGENLCFNLATRRYADKEFYESEGYIIINLNQHINRL